MRARGFRYCFTPLAGCFSPFPHGTGSLSVTGECLALEGGPPCFPPGFTCPAVLWVRPSRGMGVRVRGSHPLRPAFPCRSAPASLCNRAPGSRPRVWAARNPRWESPWGSPTHRVWAGALSLAATRAISVDFSSSGYLDVSVPRVVLAHPISFRCGWRGMTPAGFPHSETRGSKAVSASPRLIAAGRVLLRLPVPRHPPRAHGILAPHRGLELVSQTTGASDDAPQADECSHQGSNLSHNMMVFRSRCISCDR